HLWFIFDIVVDEALQDGDELGAHRPKLVQMIQSEATESVFALARKLDQNLALVGGGPEANQQAALDEAIDEADDAVVLQLHALGQRADRGPLSIGQALDGQQQ